jgi:hypothetical protein
MTDAATLPEEDALDLARAAQRSATQAGGHECACPRVIDRENK